jgi:hypothetical protein
MSRGRGDLVALGAAAIAVLCCVGLPLIGAALGGVTATAVAGVGAGIFVLLAIGALLIVRNRRGKDVR